jgi:glycosyltransferase involved in cell wall biosynthesis
VTDRTAAGGQGDVSVVVPAYNRGGLILETLDSIAAQTLRPIEVVVVDDGSTDDTAAVAAAALRERGLDGTVVTIQNSGPEAARDHGCAIARGEFLAPLDSDDLWEPRFLERMAEALARRPEVGLAFSDFVLFGEGVGAEVRKSDTLRLLRGLRWTELEADAVLFPEDAYAYLLQEQPIFPSCLFMRRSFYRQVGPFTQAIRRRDALSVEWEFLLRAARRSRFIYVRSPLSRIRKHAGNVSGVDHLMVAGTVEVLETVLREHPLSAGERRIARREASKRSWSVGYHHLVAGERRTARRWFARSLRHGWNARALAHGLVSLAPRGTLGALRRLRRRPG